MVIEKKYYPIRIKKVGEHEFWIRCPETGKIQKYFCGKNRCQYFNKRFGDICYCSHPNAKWFVEV